MFDLPKQAGGACGLLNHLFPANHVSNHFHIDLFSRRDCPRKRHFKSGTLKGVGAEPFFPM
jgi:hypothetical protein